MLDRRLFIGFFAAFGAMAESTSWTAPVEIKKGKEWAVRYRAKLTGDILWLEAAHGPGWHTYSLDNAERAKRKTGAPALGIEKSTVIQIEGGLRAISKWRQTPPKDMSQKEIEWFTWGFEGVSLFAVRVERTGAATAKLRIDAQACKSSACAMVDDAEIVVPLGAPQPASRLDDWNQLLEQGDLRDVR